MTCGDNLINGVLSVLSDTFTEDYAFYLDEQEQEIEAPCFFVRLLSVKQEQLIKNRYRRVYSLDVEYHPSTRSNIARELLEVQDALVMAVELIPDSNNGGYIRGTDIKAEVQDEVLHCFVTYTAIIVKVEEPAEDMATLTQYQSVKD